MINLLITIVVVCLLVGLVYYVLDAIPVPDPLNRIAKIACVVIGCLIIIMLLLNLAGYDTGLGRRLGALIVPPAMAQTKYQKATAPPPGHTCADFYRSRDYGSLFGNLFENPQATVAQPVYCPGQPGQPPAIAQPKERRS